MGFVEGDEMFSENYDVIVTDGFTGNVALKSIEGVAGVIKHFINQNSIEIYIINSSPISLLAQMVLRKWIHEFIMARLC